MAKDKQAVSAYKLSKNWFDFVLENPDLLTGNHTALYMWLVELNNRLAWVEKFGISVREGMDGMACKSRKTYSGCLKDLIDWGFVIMIKEGKNQYTCNVIALVKNTQPLVQQIPRHGASTGTSSDTHPQTIKPLNLETFKPFDDDEKAQARKKEIDDAISEYTGSDQPIFIKEKNVAAKKENEDGPQADVTPERKLPTLKEAVLSVERTAHWRIVMEHYNKTDAERFALFKIFYEQKEDNYRIRLPTAAAMVEHFYNWVPVHLNKANPQKLMTHGKTKFNAAASAAGNRNERNNGIADIIEQSENFLQQFNDNEYP